MLASDFSLSNIYKKKFLQEQLRRRQQCFECCSEHGVTTPDVAAAAVGQDGVIIAKKIANEPVMTFRRVLFGLRSTDAATIDNRERRVARGHASRPEFSLEDFASTGKQLQPRTHARTGGRAGCAVCLRRLSHATTNSRSEFE